MHHVTRRLLAGAIVHQFHARGEPDAAHVTNQRMSRHEPRKAVAEVRPNVTRILQKVFVPDDVQNRHAGRPGDVVAAKGGEERTELKEM